MNTKLALIPFIATAIAACGGDGSNTPANTAGTVLISGSVTEDETLTAVVADVNGTDNATITYSWTADGTTIAGATSSTFVPTDEHVGAVLAVTASYTDDDDYVEEATSEDTEAVAGVNDAGSIAVSGTPTVGEELTSSITDVDGVTGDVTYQWAAGGTDISGATSSTFTPTVSELGSTLTVSATYTDDQGFAEDIESSATDAVITTAENSAGAIAITGTTTEGETLVATVTDGNGTTNATITYAWAAGGTAISGATSASYALTADEVGDTITVSATYTDDDGFQEDVTSDATAAVAAALVNTIGAVSISGTTTVGETLTAAATDADGTTSATITYEWRAGGTAISGATASTYVLTTSEIGDAITVNVTYTDDAGFAENNTSSATAAVIAANSAGSVGAITGTAASGQTLTAGAVTDANGTTGATLTYQWAAGGSNITGATNSTYVLTDDEIGDTITVTVGYTDDDGYAESVTSAATAAVIAANSAGTIGAITGTTTEDEMLTAGAVTDANGTTGATFTYQWAAEGVDISGATDSTYVLTADEVGDTITVTVSYTDDDGYEEDVTSAATDAIAAAVGNTVGTVSAITGTTTEGETLTAGTVTDANGTTGATFTYQWAAGGVDITGATDSTYVLTADEVGDTVTVTVSYTDDADFDEDVTSDPTAAIAAAPVNTVGTIGAITGTTEVNQTLTAGAITDANGTTGATFTYQWAAGGTDIGGATNNTYTLTAAEEGDTITVTVSYTDDDGFAEAVTSAATAAIDPAPVNSDGSVSISSDGTLLVGDTLTANVTDTNGTTGSTFTYQWEADGSDISGANAQNYVLTTAEAGSVITVNVTYTDDDSFAEDITSSAATGEDTTNRVYSFLVNSEATLLTAVATAADGDWIALDAPAGASGTDDYADMAEVTVSTANITFIRVDDTAIISGTLCLNLDADGITIDGLEFENIDILTGSGCSGDSSVYINSNNITLSNSEFNGESRSVALGDPYNWIALRCYQCTIERNLFTNRGTDGEGAIISIYTSDDADDEQENIIRYNVFKDFGAGGSDSARNSSGYVLQVGRSTSDAGRDGINTISYNLFDNVNMDRRIARVQSELNVFDHNTILDSSGQIAFEDGANNTATNNIIINVDTDNNDDGGFAFSPFGHTITNNYLAGIRETSGDRGPLMFVSDYITNTFNDTLTLTTVTVANNTVLNSREPLEFASKDCNATKQFLVDLDDNLVANGEDDGMSGAFAGTVANGTGRTAVQNECDIDDASDFDNNHIYSDTFENGTANTFYTDFAGASGNITGAEGAADMTANANGLLEGQGVDAGIGADVNLLELLDDTMVGPGTTWTP